MDIRKSISNISIKAIAGLIIVLIVGFVIIQNCYRKEKINNIPLTQIKSNDVANKVKINEIERENSSLAKELETSELRGSVMAKEILQYKNEIARLKAAKHEKTIINRNLSDHEIDSVLANIGIKPVHIKRH